MFNKDEIKTMLADIIDTMEPMPGILRSDMRREWLHVVVDAAQELIRETPFQ